MSQVRSIAIILDKKCDTTQTAEDLGKQYLALIAATTTRTNNLRLQCMTRGCTEEVDAVIQLLRKGDLGEAISKLSRIERGMSS